MIYAYIVQSLIRSVSIRLESAVNEHQNNLWMKNWQESN